MKKDSPKVYRWLLGVTFLLYIIVLFNFVFFSDDFGRVSAEVLRYENMNLEPFKTIGNYIKVSGRAPKLFIINIIGNIVAFLPFGFLLGMMNKSFNWLKVLFLSIVLSCFIELTQGYMGVGVLDIDDVILNSAGGFFGYICYAIVAVRLKQTKA